MLTAIRKYLPDAQELSITVGDRWPLCRSNWFNGKELQGILAGYSWIGTNYGTGFFALGGTLSVICVTSSGKR